ncbi:MAG: nitroreductase [Desulfatiglans sp.]|nr:nitroreductase [Desulfatiglans sp.]
MPNIIINEQRCIKCNICSTVCVTGIIEKSNDSIFPRILKENENNCLQCGHCESFCKQDALLLNYLPEEKIQVSSQDSSIEPKRLSLYIKNRRSVRHFTSSLVDKEIISQIIDVARYAASGGNQQPVKWIVISGHSMVKNIAGLTVDWFRTIQNTSHPLGPYASGIISMWDSGVDLICHNAPHLLFAHIPKAEQQIDDPTEAIIAMTHIDIAAPSFGVGTCWAGLVQMAADAYKPLQEALETPKGRIIKGAMMFGYSQFEVRSIPRRNPADVIWR